MILILSSWAQTFSAKKFTNIEYEANGIKLHAYLAKPASPKNNTPAVIIFHTWQGISEVATLFCRPFGRGRLLRNCARFVSWCGKQINQYYCEHSNGIIYPAKILTRTLKPPGST